MTIYINEKEKKTKNKLLDKHIDRIIQETGAPEKDIRALFKKMRKKK